MVEQPVHPDIAPGPVEWLIRSLNRTRIQLLRRIVGAYDDPLNNTSLILLITVGANRKLLFAGDSQIENQNRQIRWCYPEASTSPSSPPDHNDQVASISNGQRRRSLNYRSPAAICHALTVQ